MKILFISEFSPLPKYRDGATIRVFNFLEQLKDNEFDYLFCTLEKNRSCELDNLFETRYLVDKKSFPTFRKYRNQNFVGKIEEVISNYKPSHIIIEGERFAFLPKKYHPITVVNVVDPLSLVELKKLKTEKFLNLKPSSNSLIISFLRNLHYLNIQIWL